MVKIDVYDRGYSKIRLKTDLQNLVRCERPIMPSLFIFRFDFRMYFDIRDNMDGWMVSKRFQSIK